MDSQPTAMAGMPLHLAATPSTVSHRRRPRKIRVVYLCRRTFAQVMRTLTCIVRFRFGRLVSVIRVSVRSMSSITVPRCIWYCLIHTCSFDVCCLLCIRYCLIAHVLCCMLVACIVCAGHVHRVAMLGSRCQHRLLVFSYPTPHPVLCIVWMWFICNLMNLYCRAGMGRETPRSTPRRGHPGSYCILLAVLVGRDARQRCLQGFLRVGGG